MPGPAWTPPETPSALEAPAARRQACRYLYAVLPEDRFAPTVTTLLPDLDATHYDSVLGGFGLVLDLENRARLYPHPTRPGVTCWHPIPLGDRPTPPALPASPGVPRP